MNAIWNVAAAALAANHLLTRAQKRALGPVLDELEADCDSVVAELVAATGPFHSQPGGTLDQEDVEQVRQVIAELREQQRQGYPWGIRRRIGAVVRRLDRALKDYEKSVRTGFFIGG